MGCASGQKVVVNGYAEPEADRRIAPGTAVAVMQDEDAENPVLEKEIARKLEKLLKEKDYSLVSREDAEILVDYSYDKALSAPAGTAGPRVSVGMGGSTGGGIFTGGGVSVPMGGGRAERVNRYRLVLQAIEAKNYRRSAVRNVLWSGDAELEARTVGLRSAMDYLLAALVPRFGEDTGKTLEVEIKEGDPEVQTIRGGN
jgi:hypothetical protein